ncbi:ImmA/IrrE family metallo-endopeptidase, partial [Planctomycetota bacterium]
GHPEHLFPNGNGCHKSKSGFVSNDEYELEADHFAASLLMPKPLFIPALRESGQGFEAIKALADLCQTSLTSTAIQYAKLSEDPVAVIVSSDNKIDYCFMSETIKDYPGIKWIRKNELLPTNVYTHIFNQNKDNITENKEEQRTSLLSDWFEGTSDIEVNEDIAGLGNYGKTLTVLFADEIPEEEHEDD